jgi:WD40 repeat protein
MQLHHRAAASVATLALVCVVFLAKSSAAHPPAKLLTDEIQHEGGIAGIAFSPNGELLAVCGGRLGRNEKEPVAELTLWDVKTRKKVRTLIGHTDYIACVAFSPDGKTLVSGSWDRTIRLWDTTTGKEFAVLKDSPDAVIAVAFEPGGKTLAGIVSTVGNGPDFSAPGMVLLWDVTTRKLRSKLQDHGGPVRGIAFSPDGKTLAAVGGRWDKDRNRFAGGEVKLWNP